MAAAPKLVSLPRRPLDPEVKSWIDNVIVPTLVKEFLASAKKGDETPNGDLPVVKCADVKRSRKGGK